MEANKGNYDLLLVGGSQSLFSDNVVGGKVKTLMSDTRCHVGALVDRNFETAEKIIVILQDFNDLFLMSFAERFMVNAGANIVLADPHRLVNTNITFSLAFEKISRENPKRLDLYEGHSPDEDYMRSFDLLLISTSGWRDVYRSASHWLQSAPSILILKPIGSQREGKAKAP
jgi:hypothetical protein